MPTDLLYLSDAYQQTASAKVIDVQAMNGQTVVILNRTLFYPQGGGQPPDIGAIIGTQGKLQVAHVSYNGGEVQHKGQLEGTLSVGDEVQLIIDWETRYRHMQWHTAGHVLDLAVKNALPLSQSVDGNHGIGKKMYVEFSTPVQPADQESVQSQLTDLIERDLPIRDEMIAKDELIARKITLPFDLPGNKPLRIVQIGDYPPMPDGGTQLKSTGESWPSTVTGIQEKDGQYRVFYEVRDPHQKIAASAIPSQPVTDSTITQSQIETESDLSLNQLEHTIDLIKHQLSQDLINHVPNLETKYLGKKGSFNDLAQVLKKIPATDKPRAGQLLNTLKQEIESQLQTYNSTNPSSSHWIDLTMPGLPAPVGHLHPISQAMDEITRIFEKIGFTRVRYPEVDWDWYVFTALNMPPNHPARDEWETFFVDAPADPTKGQMVLTTHTSNGQVREMERLQSQPPIRMINIARCYRRQQDATHTQMFHQFEGLVVDKGITIQNLKGTLDHFAQEFYGPGTKSRIRPFHFQFTEPSFEVDFSCHICEGSGEVTDQQTGEKSKCKFCKSGWHEVGGAGMVHPNVLKAGGIDPDEYTGFAFGWGVERTYTLKPGLNIDDIRYFYSGDLRFLEQF